MQIQCSACRQRLSVPDGSAGQLVRCVCSVTIRVPALASTATASAAPISPTSGPARFNRTSPPSRSSATLFDDDEFDDLTMTPPPPPLGTMARHRFESTRLEAMGHGGGQSNPYAVANRRSGAADSLLSAAMNEGGNPRVSSRDLADRSMRLLGAMIDGMVCGIPAFVSLIVMIVLGISSGYSFVGWSRSAAMLAFAAWIAVWMVPNGLFIASHGQTLGKFLTGTRIVNESDGKIPGFGRGYFLRTMLIYLAGQIVPFLGLIDAVLIFGDRSQTLHDRLAGTVVVRA